MQNSHHGEASPHSVPTRLRIHRVKQGNQIHVRTLSEAYDGLWTHYNEPSDYCSNDKRCRQCKAGKKQIWKGYFAAEAWDPSRGWWLPVVMELTENGELDLRHRFGRGQVWLLGKEKESGERRTALTAILVETLDEADLPSEFDVVGALKSLYRFPTLKLGVPNPLPDRVLVEPTAGKPPRSLTGKPAEAEASPEDWAEFRAKMKSSPASVPSGSRSKTKQG